MNPLARLSSSLRRAGRRHRRVWSGQGKAHIEVKSVRRPGSESFGRRIEAALSRLDGVQWAEVNAVVGRVVVSFDDGRLGLDDLVSVVEGCEEAQGLHEERFSFDRPEHPGDVEPIRRLLTELMTDVAALGVSVFGTVLRSTPIPVEVASLVSLVDSQPRLRHALEDRLGPALADLSLALANAVGQGLAQGPIGLVVDGVHRASLLSEAQLRRRTWCQRENELCPAPALEQSPPVERRPRPVPRPPGPVEHYGDRVGISSVAATGITGVATRNLRRTAAVLLAATPKPARLGREAFAAHLGRTLACRGALVVDSRALRHLDAVDCVLIESRWLVTGRRRIDRLVVVGDGDRPEAHGRLRRMFDVSHPEAACRRGNWTAGPLGRLNVSLEAEAEEAARSLGSDDLYGLAHRGQLVALFTVADELATGARQLVEAAHRVGHMVTIAGDDLSIIKRLGADLLVAGEGRLAESVRMLQADGCVVALVSGPNSEALVAADLGIGLFTADAAPWGADVLCFGGLRDAHFLVEATAAAREVSRQSVGLALAGSTMGTVAALVGPRHRAGGRAMLSVNLATALALANGTRAGIALARRPRPPMTAAPPWHELEVEEVLARLASSPEGLSHEEASGRRTLPEAARSAPVELTRAVLEEMANPLTPVLAGGAALSAVVGSAADALIVGAVTATNAVLGGVQRFRSEEAVRALDATSAPQVHVRRQGKMQLVAADRLVPGSIVLLEAGDAVPADCRVVEAQGLEVDESSLTGESVPVPKSARPTFGALVAERSSMLYEGTTVSAGSATAVVVATGSETEAGGSELAVERQESARGVEARLRQLGGLTLPFAAAGGAGVIGSALLNGRSLADGLGAGVSLAVAAVPEGLPVLATLAQLASARRLSSRGALVRNPRAVEALGRVDVLCTDKTGTLTEGRIELHSVFDGVTVAGRDELGWQHRLVLAAARRASPQANGPRALAHLTDRAVVQGAARAGVDVTTGPCGPGWRRLAELPFEPARGFHATVGVGAGGQVLSVKGAPEVVVPRCRRWRVGEQERALEGNARVQVSEQVDLLARRGLRLLAVAERVEPPGETNGKRPSAIDDDDVSELTLLGFVALADPVRPAAAAAVDGLRRAGVDVVMVTGDHPSTAEGIAVELGILNDHRLLTGADMERLSDSELDAVLPDVSVFARVTPTDKVRIVAAYQRAGRAVAMTGDGANDAPAIRLADAGMALGAHSTPAARGAADVVITDDRIETIVDAIIEGRAMWGSVRAALAILLGGNLGEIAYTVAASTLTGRAPLSARQILLVNLLTDVAPALVIAVRPPAQLTPEDLLAEGPERSLGTSLDREILWRAVTTAGGAGVAWVLARSTGRRRRANTIGLVALVGTQLGQTLVSGGRHPAVVGAAVVSSALLAGIVQTPGVSQFFGCTPLGPVGWAIGLGASTAATATSVAIPAAARGLARLAREGQREQPPALPANLGSAQGPPRVPNRELTTSA